MPIEVIKPEEAASHLNAIIYGDTGVGKTYLLGTAKKYAATKKALVVSADEGLLTLHGTGIDVKVVNSLRDIEDVYEALIEEDHGYGFVGLDSLTEIQQRLSIGEIKSELNNEGAYSNLTSVRQTTQPEWGVTGEHMRRIIRGFRSITTNPEAQRRAHVVMTCHEKFEEKRRRCGPDLKGQLSTEVGRYVDILGRLTVIEDDSGKLRRFLQTLQTEDDSGIVYPAKNRGGKLGAGIWDPTIKKIVTAWFGGEVAVETSSPKMSRLEQKAQEVSND